MQKEGRFSLVNTDSQLIFRSYLTEYHQGKENEFWDASVTFFVRFYNEGPESMTVRYGTKSVATLSKGQSADFVFPPRKIYNPNGDAEVQHQIAVLGANGAHSNSQGWYQIEVIPTPR